MQLYSRLRESVVLCFRYLSCMGLILSGLVVIMIAGSFGFWGWFGLFFFICLWLGRSDESPKAESTNHPEHQAGGFPLPTKGYACIAQDMKKLQAQRRSTHHSSQSNSTGWINKGEGHDR